MCQRPARFSVPDERKCQENVKTYSRAVSVEFFSKAAAMSFVPEPPILLNPRLRNNVIGVSDVSMSSYIFDQRAGTRKKERIRKCQNLLEGDQSGVPLQSRGDVLCPRIPDTVVMEAKKQRERG